jgi:hypothetical protein
MHHHRHHLWHFVLQRILRRQDNNKNLLLWTDRSIDLDCVCVFCLM